MCILLIFVGVSLDNRALRTKRRQPKYMPARDLLRVSSGNRDTPLGLIQTTNCNMMHRYLNSCNGLPNYFLYPNLPAVYRNAIINFWHVEKTGGTTVESCLINMQNDSQFEVTGPCKNLERLLNWTEYFQKASQPVIRGHSTLGFCDFVQDHIVDRKCSNFAIFREPYERVVSFYYFSRSRVKATVKNRDRRERYLKTNITEWVKRRGSTYWMAFTQGRVLDKKNTSSGSCGTTSNITEKWPPKIDKFPKSIVDNLDKHLSVVGLTEDLPGSYEMLQEVYGLPFVESCSNSHLLRGTYEGGEKQRLKEQAKRALTENEEIRRIMEFDVMIYEKAKEIFQKQKEIMSMWGGKLT